MPARSPVRTLARALAPDLENLSGDQRDAVNALAQHMLLRLEQTEFEPFDEDGKTFISNGWMQCRLRDVGARCQGEKAAAKALRWLCENGLLENTGEVKKPRRRENREAAREKFGRGEGAAGGEGGRDPQPSLHRSYWWRVYRVVPLSGALKAYEKLQGAYGRFLEVPQHLASLSAWAICQGLISHHRGRTGARSGSVQYAYLHSGPP